MSNKPLIIRKESTRFRGLYVEKYTKSVFWDNLWDQNPDLVESRGVVKDASNNVVIRPFTKIFNRGENGTDIDRDEKVLAVQKINGFMACATFVECVGGHGQVVVSTTGSLDSEFVTLAERYLLNNRVEEYIIKNHAPARPMTYLFEVCAPEDPHIIPEKEGAWLIGARYVADHVPYFSSHFKEEALDKIATEMGVLRPGWKEWEHFGNLVDTMPRVRHEGFCVYGQQSRTVLKMKSPYYLALKAAARIKDISSLDKKRVDEEFYPLIDFLSSQANGFNALPEQDRLRIIRNLINSDAQEN